MAVRLILVFTLPYFSVQTAYYIQYGVFPVFLIGIPLIFLYGFYGFSSTFNHIARAKLRQKK